VCTLLSPEMLIPPLFDRDQLILQSAPLVRRAVGRYLVRRPGVLDPEDVVSYGTMGLIDAIDRYDRSRGVKFETYAITRIRGYLIDQLRSLDWLPRSARSNIRLVQAASAKLEASLGREPEAAELATCTGLSSGFCSQALTDAAARIVSLDAIAPTNDDLSSNLVRQVEDDSCLSPAAAVEQQETHDDLMQALETLPARESTVIRLRYMEDWTYREIAAHLGVSESRVSQLHAQGLSHMRQTLGAEHEAMTSESSGASRSAEPAVVSARTTKQAGGLGEADSGAAALTQSRKALAA
jgi:RNA polymerase sigma factor for flagellar operon FliA